MDQAQFSEEVSAELARDIALSRVRAEIENAQAELESAPRDKRRVLFERLVVLHMSEIKLADPTAGIYRVRA